MPDYTRLRRHQRHRIFVINDPTTLRIVPALAMEIGFNESIVLLQLEYLISISDNERDGRMWTYQSLQSLQENWFPFMSQTTIARALKSLLAQQLILKGNYNRASFDRTTWYALNEVGLAGLQAITYREP